jgi:two-component system chemotaxis response regulator CheB
MENAGTLRADARSDEANAIRVMVVDDSAVIRGLVTKALETDRRVHVVATAANGLIATQTIRRADPDVLILDIEMPVMDGITALPKLLEVRPGTPIIIASTLSQQGAEISLKALSLGAADYIPKPVASQVGSNEEFRRELIARVLQFGGRSRARRAPTAGAAPGAARASVGTAPSAVPIALRKPSSFPPHILAIGSSTGGPQALNALLKDVPLSIGAPIVITQHMPPTFTTILAQHVAKASGWPCAEAAEGETIKAGKIYIAPGNHHFVIERKGSDRVVRLTSDAPENFCRPAVDPMLRSLAAAYGPRVLTVVLTGMGSDGLKGGRDLVNAGGTVIAQDEASSVVWGMPGAVATAGLCAAVLPIPDLAKYIVRSFAGSAS